MALVGNRPQPRLTSPSGWVSPVPVLSEFEAVTRRRRERRHRGAVRARHRADRAGTRAALDQHPAGGARGEGRAGPVPGRAPGRRGLPDRQRARAAGRGVPAGTAAQADGAPAGWRSSCCSTAGSPRARSTCSASPWWTTQAGRRRGHRRAFREPCRGVPAAAGVQPPRPARPVHQAVPAGRRGGAGGPGGAGVRAGRVRQRLLRGRRPRCGRASASSGPDSDRPASAGQASSPDLRRRGKQLSSGSAPACTGPRRRRRCTPPGPWSAWSACRRAPRGGCGRPSRPALRQAVHLACRTPGAW